MATEIEEVKKVEHKNIFGALSAFQGENPEIAQTKEVEFDAGGKKVKFKYAPLDGILKVVRPLLAKHGLSITFEKAQEGMMCAALYHETYKISEEKVSEMLKETPTGESALTSRTYKKGEEGVIRSMPITVVRTGDMKKVGGESTYARRYMISEILGISSDEDNDIEGLEQKAEKLEKFAFSTSKKNITNATSIAKVDEFIKFFKRELVQVESKKETTLSLTKEQYEELIKIAEDRKVEISKKASDQEIPGENHDAGGEIETE